jgi:hexosaminidase
MNESLIDLSANAPLVQPILPLSKSLSEVSEQMLPMIEENKLYRMTMLKDLVEKCNSKRTPTWTCCIYNLEEIVENVID